MKVKLNIALLLFLALCGKAAIGQTTLERSVIATSGKSISIGGTYHLQSTTGQVAVRSINPGTYHLSEGFQHGTLLVTTLEDPAENFPLSRIYPTPTAAILHVETGLVKKSDQLLIRFSDLSGQLLEVPMEKTGSGTFRLNLKGVAQGTYFLRLIDAHSGKQRSWKVSKIN